MGIWSFLVTLLEQGLLFVPITQLQDGRDEIGSFLSCLHGVAPPHISPSQGYPPTKPPTYVPYWYLGLVSRLVAHEKGHSQSKHIHVSAPMLASTHQHISCILLILPPMSHPPKDAHQPNHPHAFHVGAWDWCLARWPMKRGTAKASTSTSAHPLATNNTHSGMPPFSQE